MLPARRRSGSGSKEVTIAQLDGRGRRILIVDADRTVRVILDEVLRQMKFDVGLAEDAVTGLNMMESEVSYDLIIVDLMMPFHHNGYQFIEQVGERYPEKRPHIIVLTSAGRRKVEKIPQKATTFASSLCAEISIYQSIGERTGAMVERSAIRGKKGLCKSMRDLAIKSRVLGDGYYYIPIELWPKSICFALAKPFDLDRFIEIIGQCMNAAHETHETHEARRIKVVEQRKVAPARPSKKFILVVDTDLKLCQTYRDLLEPYGFAVTYVSTPAAARAYLPRVDLLILELLLVPESGFALLDELRREHPSLLGRTLIITGARLKQLEYVLGDVPAIEKPFHVAELLDIAGLIAAYPVERSLGEEWDAQLPKLIASYASDTKPGERTQVSAGKATLRRRIGFARLDPATMREVASKGGRAAHAQGRAHEFTSETAAIAGRKGGENASRDRTHMAEIGREGAHVRAGKSRTKKR